MQTGAAEHARRTDALEQVLRTHNAVLMTLSCSSAIGQGLQDKAFREIARAAAKTLDLERVSTWLFSEDRLKICCVAQYERNRKHHSRGVVLCASDYPSYFSAIMKDRTLAADDAQHDPRTCEFAQGYLKPLGITSLLDAPVRIGGRMIGLICHEHIGAMRHWTVEEQVFAGSMADFVAMAIQAAERRRDAEKVKASERQLRQIIDLVPHMILVSARDGRILLANQTAAGAFGTTVDQLIGQTLHPADAGAKQRAAIKQALHAAVDQKQPSAIPELLFNDARGARRILHAMLMPIEIVNCDEPAVLSVLIDITQHKLAEERLAHMVQELNHRVKNNLAAVLSIAEQTMVGASSLEVFYRAFSGRIRAMAVSHEMLADSNWSSISLHDMLSRLLEPYRGCGDVNRVRLDGPLIMLPAAIAPPLGMIVHELTTNAVKYGALSQLAGRVHVAWETRVGRNGKHRLRLVWREHDAPDVQPPARRGFGTELIERIAAHQLHGRAILRFELQGLRCSVTIPLPLDADSSSATQQTDNGSGASD